MSFFRQILIWGRQSAVEPKLRSPRSWQHFGLIGLGLALITSLHVSAIAQPTPRSLRLTAVLPSDTPLDRQLLTEEQEAVMVLSPGACSDETLVITSNTICQNGLTVPSLWWFNEQYREANGKLVDTWFAYPNQTGRDRRVDVVVNQQVWSLLDYLERYEFVDWLGSVARDYRFNTRVFNSQGTLLSAYTCEFQEGSTTDLPTCRLFVDSLGRDGLGRPTTLPE
jgi:hypothetical protein